MKKILIILGSLIGLLAILLIIYWFFIKGTVVVSTNLSDSKIFVNSVSQPDFFEPLGNGKVEIKLKAGNYRIRVERKGYVAYLKNIKIYGLQTNETRIDLKELPEVSLVENNISSLDWDAEKKNLLIGSAGGSKFESLNPATNARQPLSRVNFGSEKKVKWSPNRYLAYIWHADGSAGLVDLKRYDLLYQEFHPWPSTVQDLAWSNDGKQVTYVYRPGNGEFSLIGASPANENMERLLLRIDQQGMKDPYLEWTKNDKDLMMADKDIYIYNFYSHELKKITSSSDVKMARLSFNGKYVIYTTPEGTYLVKLDGSDRKRVGDAFDIFNWMPGGNEIIGIKDGVWKKLNVTNGETLEYGYNGSKIKDVKSITTTEGSNNVYYISGEALYSLELQPITVDL